MWRCAPSKGMHATFRCVAKMKFSEAVSMYGASPFILCYEPC